MALWENDKTPFSGWSVHKWGAPGDKQRGMAIRYANLAKVLKEKYSFDKANEYIHKAISLTFEAGLTEERSSERVSKKLGESIGKVLGVYFTIR